MLLQKWGVYFSTACMLCYMIVLNIIIRIMHFVSPGLAKKQILRLGEKITMTQNPRFGYEDWGPTFKSFNFVKTASEHMWLSLGQEAFVGGEAPDSPVVTMDGEKTSVLSYLRDGWAFTNNFDINRHRSLEDRLSAAQILVGREPLCPVVVDEMNDVAAIKYGALPERLYVLQSGKVVYKVRPVPYQHQDTFPHFHCVGPRLGGMGPWGYRPLEVRLFLEKMK
ncbi:type I iodothyronine deiodinase isoform X3 [Xiphias gladius]|uniref:type I iodothyronine deiodinase isoform X3 n=1 Tax=Xiphias gladius TaxID=8245 RepID=UPI001A98AB2F|nr:type I iodothyronine deiodinase isoform X3 [Xiphias gladius]